jgi:ferrous iron transport protein B
MNDTKGYDYTVAIVGNPNSGKTTVFNLLTGANQRVGNWPGVTVEKKEGTFQCGNRVVNLVDLPGIYSVSATSEDERVARDYLLSGEADLIIDIVDASNLERNLYLTIQLIEMGLPVLLVLNMMDIAEESGVRIDLDHLTKHLQLPLIGVNGTDPRSRDVILQKLQALLGETPRSSFQVSYGNELEDVIERLQPSLEPLAKKLHITPRYAAIKLIEGDPYVESLVLAEGLVDLKTLTKEKERIRHVLKDEPDTVIADARYGAIHGIVKEVTRKVRQKVSLTEKIDRIALHKVFGIPLFLLAMYLVFLVTMKVGGAFIDFFDLFFGTIFVDGGMALLRWLGAPSWVIAAVAGGLGTGIQTVATFIPIIFTLFFALSILEDSGYMSRAAFVMDRFMKSIGLPGKAFVPLLVGFGCTVPAILGTRTLDSRRDRLMTIFMSPFMSCGARLPVYALFAAAFFSESAGTIVFSLYLVGILYAILTGLLLKATVFHGEPAHLIMELPPYHRPRLRHILIHTWLRLKIFLFRAGKVILGMVLVLGLFNSIGFSDEGVGFGHENTERSLLSLVGKRITPVFEPMGVRRENWPATVGLFTGILAKESVVGTLNSLYGQTQAVKEGGEEFDFWGEIRSAFQSIPKNLIAIGEALLDPIGWKTVEASGKSPEEAPRGNETAVDTVKPSRESQRGTEGTARNESKPEGSEVFARLRSSFSPVGAFAYLLFVLLYFPCVAAQGAAIRELGKRAGIALATYMTVLAWATAVLYYQVLEGGKVGWIALALGIFFLIWAVFARFGKKLLSLE